MSTGGPEPQQDDPLDDPASYGVEGSAVESPNPGKGSLRRQAFPPCLHEAGTFAACVEVAQVDEDFDGLVVALRLSGSDEGFNLGP